MKKELSIYIGNENFYVIDNNLNIIHTIKSDGMFNSENLKNPIQDENSFSSLLGDIKAKYPFKTLVLSDICFNAGILTVKNFPLSRAKRSEVLTWKLKGVLPYSVDSYSLKYYLTDKNALIYYALPVTIGDALNALLEKEQLKCWNIVPESVFIADFLPDKERHTLLFIVRRDYFSAILLSRKTPVYVKIRKRVKAISLEEEIKLVEKVISENLKLTEFERLVCSSEQVEGFRNIFKGFDFEY